MNLLVVAGEISGDQHAAHLIRELKALRPDVDIWGLGGDEMQAEGVELLYHTRDLAVLGLAEVLRKYGFFRRVFRELKSEMLKRKPDAILLVDYPGFNLRLANVAHEAGIKVLYYICPQVWAWHRSRMKTMARDLDRLMVILPFEANLFDPLGLHTDFVGHPLVEPTHQVLESEDEPLPWPGAERLLLLPGSRGQELERNLPPMAQAAALLERECPDLGSLIIAPNEELAARAKDILSQLKNGPQRVCIQLRQARQAMKQARAALVSSGTATLETALMQCPMVIMYKTSPFTYAVARHLVKIPYIGLVNLVAEREVCPEYIQNEASPEKLAQAMRLLLDDTPERTRMKDDLHAIREMLARPTGPSAAAIVAEELG